MFSAQHGSPSLFGKTEVAHFGAFIKLIRHRHGLRQLDVLAHLPGWTQATYSRLETGEVAPAFDQLALIYQALRLAGVQWTVADRQQFLALARQRIEAKRTYQERKTDQEWDVLRLTLSREGPLLHGQERPAQKEKPVVPDPRWLETRHLVGREDWLASVITSLQGPLAKKLVVLQGPIGIGKSSELHRIALHMLSGEDPRPVVILCELPIEEQPIEPESMLDVLLGTILAELGFAEVFASLSSLDARMSFVFRCLEKTARPCMLLLDNAEHLLDEQGQLAGCWERFLATLLRRQHRASLVIATREWPGWFGGERVFVVERSVPPLSTETGALLLQQLGLSSIPPVYLQQASEAVGGVPLCLEWVATLVQEPWWLDHWEEEDMREGSAEDPITQRLVRLLEDAALFDGPITSKLTPLLDRILAKRLSPEATQVLQTLALARIPLGKPALQRICPRPRLLKELEAASLLMAYKQRIQVLPMVASIIRSRLSAEQSHALETELIEAYLRWLHEGKADQHELGVLIAELTMLYLKQHRLLDAAQLLIRYGWLSFNRGYGPRLARFSIQIMEGFDWHTTREDEYGGLLLYYFLSPYLGKSVDTTQKFVDYQHLYNAVINKEVVFSPLTESHITNNLILHYMNRLQFEEAYSLLKVSCTQSHLSPLADVELQASLLDKQAWLFGKWCEYIQEQGNSQKAKVVREQAISLWKECIQLLSTREEKSSAKGSLLKRRLARAFNNLAYHLYRNGQFEEALSVVEQAILLREQGYAEIFGLATSYSQKSEILVELGRFREALLFDEKALTEIQKWAGTGHTLSQEEEWIYWVNRGRLYLRLGKVDEAEQLLREALPHIRPRRSVYRMFAENSLNEIDQWRSHTTSSSYQLDWRWIRQLRELVAYDAYWWWAHAGPFTEEELQQWHQFSTPNPAEPTRDKLATLIAQSRERELATALAERREPRLWYPALDIEDVRRRLTALHHLHTTIAQQEPNAIVRRLYLEKIEEECAFLELIQATQEGSNERFRHYSWQVYPEPTREELAYALARVCKVIQQGMQKPETEAMSRQLQHMVRDHLQVMPHLLPDVAPEEYAQENKETVRLMSAQGAKRFFEAALQESGYEGWQVVIDKASSTRVESGLRRIILADGPISVERVRHYLIHELGGHVARSIAGERSALGLLGVGTKNYSTTEEGLALYQERELAKRDGYPFSDWGAILGTLSTGLASGVMTPPQSFFELCNFLETFFLLRRLLKQQDQERTLAQKHARKTALANCLRTFRGVPHLEEKGSCLTKDVIYLRGLWQVEQAVAQDAAILQQLTVGKVALEYLPDLQELGLVASPSPLAKLASATELDTYILSFEDGSYAR